MPVVTEKAPTQSAGGVPGGWQRQTPPALPSRPGTGNGTAPSGRGTSLGFAPFACQCLEAFAARWTPATRGRYARSLRADLLPVLGGRRLGALTPADVRDAIIRLRAWGCGPERLTTTLSLLQRILRVAGRRGLLREDLVAAMRGGPLVRWAWPWARPSVGTWSSA